VAVNGGLSAAGIAAIRLLVVGGVAVALAWPYMQDYIPYPPPHQRPTPTVPPPTQTGSAPDLTLLLLAFAVAATAAALVLVVWIGQRRLNPRSRADDEPVLGSDRLGQGRPEIADEALSALMLHADARRAILACYMQLERALARRGFPRPPEQTALEYSRRVLEQAGAPIEPVRRLTMLFHLAAFSSHAIDDSMREVAIESVRAIGGATQ